MSNQSLISNMKLVGYRIGDTYCLSPSRSLEALDSLPRTMSQVPGTKPWVLGVGRLGRELVAFISAGRLLSIPRSVTQQAPGSEIALFVKGDQRVGTIGLVVDEVLAFISGSDVEDHQDPDLKIPPGLGACVRGTVRDNQRTWAVVDLKSVLSDPKLQKIDL
ncbi:chemotaxis protein CheW [Pseudomonas sp. NCHU5208]|uniref:chemotaxis protein CheW n=1 Tax=unclassified Pseudomonas TaxID=196821 RepID=UPI003F9ACE06